MVFEESVTLAQPFDEALARVKESLAAEGFGVLTEVDMQETFDLRIGKDIDRFVILGACNPQLASRALDVEPQLGVLLPCNVVVRESSAGVCVEAMDPGVMITLAGRDELRPIVDDARKLIGDALDRLLPAAA
ncbi:MAG: DUF302 domain-containing protein [Actinomycetota bacterium]|jgi:uncharacterized protein (DUF302 family)|nr:DUF302 domain-containing protein [Actinomycetota bacterium]